MHEELPGNAGDGSTSTPIVLGDDDAPTSEEVQTLCRYTQKAGVGETPCLGILLGK